ncbi:hypothetical protein IFM89_027110 [Coptis chinensis]|uniref:Pentatricopeptide repeat-containing protein n=1 Tax=Coptis chinensis TaxID=261450 RepID=A0A835M4B3_9MAGN|nr:hypothetical protein IFM89_027110 [Coptis chinensis]
MASLTCCLNCTSSSHDLRSWNKIIKHHVLEGNPDQAIRTYRNMLVDGYIGDNYTFPVLLKAAARLSSSHIGSVLHGQIMKSRFWIHDFVQTALLNLYSTLGRVEDGFKVFKDMTRKDLIAWNSMLDAYASAGQMDNAANLFSLMPSKDHISFNTMISGFANIGNVEAARQIFDQLTDGDVVSWNSMVLAYTKVGDMERACALFDQMPERNVVSWNTMLCGYLQSGCYSSVVGLFNDLRGMDELEPNHVTLTTVLSACARMGALDTGTGIHILAIDIGLMLDPKVMVSVIDMYAKCGSIERALEVFYKIKSKDTYCWNAIICGLALHGYGCAALNSFEDMNTTGLSPDDITFIGLLSACSHVGMVEEGCLLFKSMVNTFGVSPKLEHYSCMVDLLGRAGFLKNAFRLIETMPFEPGPTVWGALLGACVIHRDIEVGDIIAKRFAARIECLSDGEYVMLANLYASCGRWDEANRWRAMMHDLDINKTSGNSMIEVNGTMYKFLAGHLK